MAGRQQRIGAGRRDLAFSLPDSDVESLIEGDAGILSLSIGQPAQALAVWSTKAGKQLTAGVDCAAPMTMLGMMPELTLSRRRLVSWLCASAALPAIAACGGSAAEAKAFPVSYSDAEWRRRLTADQYDILRRKGTERPGSSPLLHEKRRGTFICAADNHPLFASDTKFESGTGWPSFWRPLPAAIGTSTDYEVGMPRTEVHCARCGGHLGHVFNDGPKPTGKRYCMNGDALLFRPA